MLIGKPKTIIHLHRTPVQIGDAVVPIQVQFSFTFAGIISMYGLSMPVLLQKKKYKEARATKEKLGLKCFGRGEVHISPYP